MRQTLLLVYSSAGLMNESQVVGVVTDEYGFEVWEYFEVSDDPVDGEGGYFEGLVVSCDVEDGDCLFFPSGEVEGVAFFAELQVGDDLVVAETGEPHFAQRLVVEADLIAGHKADSRQCHHFHHHADWQIVIVDARDLLDFFWP
jgi:hypothetical protein